MTKQRNTRRRQAEAYLRHYERHECDYRLSLAAIQRRAHGRVLRSPYVRRAERARLHAQYRFVHDMIFKGEVITRA